MKKIFIFLLVFLISASLNAAGEGFSSLEEQMSGKEFSAAGLHKLSPAELDALNDWIRRHSLGTLDTPTAPAAGAATAAPASTTNVDRRGLPSDDKEDETPITSRIVGTFDGWDGQTVFKLENGMIWVQADKDKFYVKELSNPEVVISPGMFSVWYLRVEGYNSKCKVKRIQ